MILNGHIHCIKKGDGVVLFTSAAQWGKYTYVLDLQAYNSSSLSEDIVIGLEVAFA